MEKEPFKPQMRLVVQASIPIQDSADGKAEYNNLKIFLLSISPEITLTGRLVEALKPYYKDKQKGESHAKDP